MQRFTRSIEASLVARNWFGALFLALAIPDICGALENPDRPVGERYRDWFQRYLRAKYYPTSMLEATEATHPELLQGLTPERIEALRNRRPPAETAFTADDCYRLRCKCLHQGLPQRADDERIHFTLPDPLRRVRFHLTFNHGVLQLSVAEFCRDIARAAEQWSREVQGDAAIAERIGSLIKLYDLDAVELPLVGYA